MKKLMLLLAMTFAVITFVSAQNSALEKWIKQSESTTSDCKMSYQGEKIVINGEILTQNKSAKQSFANSLMFFALNIPSKNIFKKIDENQQTFLIRTNIPSKSKFAKDGSRYEFSISVMATDRAIVYKIYNIRYIKQTGLLLNKIKEKDFEEIFSSNKSIQTSNSIIKEEFNNGINRLLNDMYQKCPNESHPIITHWEQIKSETVKKGMTSDECILSWGKPTDKNRTIGSWGVDEQWIYPNDNYLYFENGILTTIQN